MTEIDLDGLGEVRTDWSLAELNPLIPLDHCDRTSGTPAAKSIPVKVAVS